MDYGKDGKYENYHKIPIEKKDLHTPPLEDLANYLNDGLKQNFEQVSVAVVDCPDLTKKPFVLANKGLCGHTKLVDLGGVPYLLPTVQRHKVYELKHIMILTESDPCFIIGAGAGPHPYAGVNCEAIVNLNIDAKGAINQKTRIAKVNLNDESIIIQDILPNEETRVSLLANLFISEGKPGKVLEVKAKRRIGSNDFIGSIREVLEANYKDKVVGLGGTFLLQTGKAKQHVMRDFSTTPINNDNDLNKWLKFYDMSAPLVAVGTLINNDAGLDLRVQHFHSFSCHGEGGHYHIDVTPDIVEYVGYFNVGQEIYRIDRPEETHQYGRD